MKNYTPKYPASFINNIADEGTKEEAVLALQKLWDEFQEWKAKISQELGSCLSPTRRRTSVDRLPKPE